MKRFILLLMAVFAVSAFVGCSSDDDNTPDTDNPAADITGTYSGYTKAEFQYAATPMYVDSESLTISEGADGTANIIFTSSSWGSFQATGIEVAMNNGTYTLSGSGSVEMGMSGAEASSYEYTLAGTVKSKTDATFTFTVPSVMGGLAITFTTGTLPSQYAIAGAYEGYTNAGSSYFSDMITADETLTITSNEDGTANLAFESQLWGDYEIEGIEISAANGVYTITGEGTVSMAMQGGEPSEYSFTMTGTIRSTEDATVTFTLPAIMGGLTIAFTTGDVPHVLAIQGTYSGYTKGNSNYVTDMITADETLKITVNEDGGADVTCNSPAWGEFTIEEIDIVENESMYTITGTGTVMMSMQGGEPTEYACELEGVIESTENATITFTIPAVMGGTTVEFTTGEAPAEE